MVDTRIRREAAGITAANLRDEHPQAVQIGLHPCVAAGVAELCFQLVQRGLAMLDGVPHPLPCDAEIFGNFS